MKSKYTLLAILLGVVICSSVRADIIFGHRCTYNPAHGIFPASLDCEQVVVKVELEQFLEPPPIFDPPPICPDCAYVEIIDVPGLDNSNVKGPADFAVGTRLVSDQHLPLHAMDDPLIPNLLLTYVGDQTVAAPSDVGVMSLHVLDFPEEIKELKYHAQAFDANGQFVYNAGSIPIVPEPGTAVLSILGVAVLGLGRGRRRD